MLGMLFAAALLLGAGTSGARADVEDFRFDSWNVGVELSKRPDGHASARVTETITARFPDRDQNRGIVVAKYLDYQGASIDAKDFTVTNASGASVPFELEHRDGYVAVLTGDDRYVHGAQTYVISYSLSDTIMPRDDGTADEFYWDLVSPERKQPIGKFSASIVFDEPLAAELNSQRKCYVGAADSRDECSISGTGTAADPLTVAPVALPPMQGVTVAVGLQPGSVTQPAGRGEQGGDAPRSTFLRDSPLVVYGPLACGGAAALAGVLGYVSVLRMKFRSRRARGTVIPQYDVPANLPPLIAAPIAGATGKASAAEIVHLAVSNAIQIEQAEGKPGFFGKKFPDPVLRLVDRNAAGDPLDSRALQEIFPSGGPGAAFTVPDESTAFASQMDDLASAGTTAASDRGYFTTRRAPASRLVRIAGLVLVAAGIVLSLLSIPARGFGGALVGFVPLIPGIILILMSSAKHVVHTELGAETREYLLGVRMFISVAEAERISMLQSALGAERREVDGATVVELYEKLLPYAMIFGLEKSWAKVLQTSYESVPGYAPAWYPAAGAAGFAAIGSTIERFTSTLSSSAAYTSSSSGGSTGGGFVGGGGGGGFSGGR
ncbi:DUF2207 domain-containing protein [Leucobacter sp. CSA2]|uniref:DUF2207 domain-containing protein n=1 Tax=Leucobacter edaphi TaxID=2796472 RepID=A0A934UWP6_9MICO|nr:DUF2207 domain-containing protein [Leucobacter edaphi]